jgi:hypothetical protein
MAPMPTHVISAPTATITQRYDDPICKTLLVRSSPREADAVSRTRRMGTCEGYWFAEFISGLDFGKMTGTEATRWLNL